MKVYKYNNINSLICDIISTESVIAYHVDSQKAVASLHLAVIQYRYTFYRQRSG
ncbi:hypothetical protein SAMN04488689_104408 [Paenibacillus sp. cl6col]|uniref:Uncharacterized protein n=1 Tax=Paenibacillus alvei TaxID=44250 RepID=A0A383RL36_PAEAL|nr:hypothetical protein SAMN04488689_104408 [Paenibacillus sp. cl6col]SYX87553.1 conserved protein of unknown function [Paenibacillus alvei]